MSKNYNIERTILSTILNCDFALEQDFQKIAFFSLNPAYFTDKIHRFFADVIIKLQKKDIPPAEITVAEVAKLHKQTQSIQQSWFSILETTPTFYKNLLFLNSLLQEEYEKRVLGALKW